MSVLVDAIGPDRAKSLILSVGTGRASRPLSPIEVTDALAKARRAGLSMEELAELLRLQSTDMIQRFLRVGGLPTHVQDLIDWGQTASTLSFSSAVELARLDSEDSQQSLAYAALEHGLSNAETRQVVQLCKRGARPVSDAVIEVVGMRTQVVRRHVFIGRVVDQSTVTELAARSQRQRDELLGVQIESLGLHERPTGMRMGTDQFVLVFVDPSRETLRQFGELEARTQEALRSELLS